MPKRASGQPIRVLIAEQSRAQRELLIGLVRGSGLVVAGTASDSHEAVAAATRMRPDVIAMNIDMPGLDGYAATRQIMQACPTPIVLVTRNGDAHQRAVATLAAGALTVIRMPDDGDSTEQAATRANFVTTLRLMADVLVVTRHPERALSHALPANQAVEIRALHCQRTIACGQNDALDAPKILAIGASTGGPAAVQMLLCGLGAGYPLPILLAQHIARGFVEPLAQWLAQTTALPVHIAQPSEPLRAGHVYLAPDDQHLSIFMRGYAAYRPLRPEDRYCPSADTLFETVAEVYGRRAIGVILTGMGDDGARGLRALRAAGGRTFAQNEASCVVYGMPRAAVEIGAAEHVAPLPELAQAIRELT